MSNEDLWKRRNASRKSTRTGFSIDATLEVFRKRIAARAAAKPGDQLGLDPALFGKLPYEEQERLAQQFEDCVIQRMTEQPELSREQAEALCLPGSKPTDEPTPPGAAGYHGISSTPANVAIGTDSNSEIRAYWRRADRRQRIRKTIDTTNPLELSPHSRCIEALVSILHIKRSEADLACTKIEKGREILNNASIQASGPLTDEEIMENCIASVMSSQHVTEEIAAGVCDKVLYPGEHGQITHTKHPGLAALPMVIGENDFVGAVEARMNTLTHESVPEASFQVATSFATDVKFAFAWKNQRRRERAIAECASWRAKRDNVSKEAAKASCEERYLFTKFYDDDPTHNVEGDIWEYIGEQTIIRSRLFGVSEKTARDWVQKELQKKGLLSKRTPLPSRKEPVIGDLFLKTDAQIRRMNKKSKKGLDGLYLTKPYTLKRDEDNDQVEQLEACITLHMEKEGWSRAKAKEYCLKDLEHSDLPGGT